LLRSPGRFEILGGDERKTRGKKKKAKRTHTTKRLRKVGGRGGIRLGPKNCHLTLENNRKDGGRPRGREGVGHCTCRMLKFFVSKLVLESTRERRRGVTTEGEIKGRRVALIERRRKGQKAS